MDFIDITKFPVFNFADIFICIGVIGFGISALKYVNTNNIKKS